MMDHGFRELAVDHIPAMADLLMARQEAEAGVFPFLQNSCLNREYIIGFFQELFAGSRIIGVGAYAGDDLIGFLAADIKISNRIGRCAWVPYEGLAIRANQSAELIRHLYARAAVLWLEQGCFRHSILVPLGSKVYFDACLNLSFSVEQVHAVLNVDAYQTLATTADVEVRLADRMDGDKLGRMAAVISEYQNAAPVFVPVLPEVLQAIREGFRKMVEEDDIVLIAESDGREAGFHDYEVTKPNMMSPDNAVELVVAGTPHSQMGRGIGRKLMNEGCRIVRDRGYKSIVTDWKIANLASSTFWPKCGFKPVAYRMARYIDPSYAWANFSNPAIRKL